MKKNTKRGLYEVSAMVASAVVLLLIVISPVIFARIPSPAEMFLWSVLAPGVLIVFWTRHLIKRDIRSISKGIIISGYAAVLLTISLVNIWLIGTIWATI